MDLHRYFKNLFILKFIVVTFFVCCGQADIQPVVVVTWNFPNATQKAWEVLYTEKRSALDGVEQGCKMCEQLQCARTVGYGGNPDENGETTLDALIMDGMTMDVGAIGGLRNVKDAISVARKVMENTRHSLMGGDQATDFAKQMGFKVETLQTERSHFFWERWKNESCQPNFWENVEPNPSTSCGPYRLPEASAQSNQPPKTNVPTTDENNHDTIGVAALDVKGRLAAGVSTNGQNHKIPGRIGDSAVVGAGAYADGEIGAAVSTGNGDIMMRFLPSYLAVEQMRLGASPSAASETAVRRMARHYPTFHGAVIALNAAGEYGGACYGWPEIPYYVANVKTDGPEMLRLSCIELPSN